MEIATVQSTAEIIEDYVHPNLAYARFIFADDRPNGNKQGIAYEDFPKLMKSAIDMPIKLRFMTNAAGGHKGSIPIGHIRRIEENTLDDGIHQLIAEAVLYSEEYPEEITFLKEAYASGNAPGISWEVKYEREVIKDGIAWLKGAIATAATFVKFPAYGARTALLALASIDITDEEMSQELNALASEFSDITNKGGNTMDEIKELQEKIETLQKQLAEALEAKKNAESALTSAQAEVTSKDEVIAQYQRTALVEDRTKAVTEAGIKMEVDDAKKEFLAALSEDVFAQYLADLTAASKTVAAPQKATASLRGLDVPKLGTATSEGPVDISSLRDRMRGYSRETVTVTE